MTENAIQPAITPHEKRGRGRPTKYDPSFCDAIIGYGRMGFSKAEMANAFDVIRETLDEWAKAHPDFSDALRQATEASFAWWENKAREGVDKGSMINANLWARSMAGRFPSETYRDDKKIALVGGDPAAGDKPIQTEIKVTLVRPDK